MQVPIDQGRHLEGDLEVPQGAFGIVVFAHGSGSSRHSPRNKHVAKTLQKGGLATLLIDLLTMDEEEEDMATAHLRFDIGLLTKRLCAVTDWLMKDKKAAHLQIGYFGASTGAAAALSAAAEKKGAVKAVVSRGGRPDLATHLPQVEAPTLLIVGGYDVPVIGMNEEALELLQCEKKLIIVPKATHLFEEPGALDQVAQLALSWFSQHLK
ncbi:MAG: dienelactone hydrolase family protein [Parachlamydiales bacterium]|nr:alpha/beta hydrolase [Verrucomicrobiota bacterium]